MKGNKFFYQVFKQFLNFMPESNKNYFRNLTQKEKNKRFKKKLQQNII